MRILRSLKKRQWPNFLDDIRPIALLLTIISVFIYISSGNPINRDGILYLKAAQSFLDSGIKGLLRLYKWPFYPILIAITSKYLFISLENAAYAWNTLFVAIIVVAFISIVREVKVSRSLQFFSMIIIIGHPRLHHWTKYIIRDLGYWAFLMLFVLCIIRYCHKARWKHFLLGGLCLIIASLFRIEGIIFILLYPLIFLVREEPFFNRMKKALLLYAILLVISGMAAFFCHLKGINIYTSTRLSEINIYMKCFSKVSAKLHHKGVMAGNAILAKPAKKWGTLFVSSGLMGIFIYKLIMTIWPVHFLLALYSILKGLFSTNRKIMAIIWILLAINILIPLFFLYESFFLSYRFLMPASLLILLFVPFALERIYNNIRENKNRSLKIFNTIIMLTFFVLFIGAYMPPKHSKAYIRDAAIWIRHNIPSDCPIYSNDYVPELSYYSKHQIKKIIPSQKKIITNGYLVLSIRSQIKKKDFCSGDLTRLAYFSNNEGKVIYIFRCK